MLRLDYPSTHPSIPLPFLPPVLPTPQELLDLSAGLCCGELVNDVQGRLAVGVPHRCIDAALKTTRQEQE